MATPIPANRAAFSLTAIMACTGGRVRGPLADAAMDIRGISTDTRSLGAGQAFVALSGERFDGHDHLDAARDRGAVLAIVERDVAVEGLTLLRVENSLEALGAIASCHLQRWRSAPPQGARRVLALTGSAGKTTTKSAIAGVLEQLAPGQARCTPGNLNNLVGVPMVLLGLEPAHRYAVLEIGTNAPGEIGKLSRMLRPDAGLITLIGTAHTEGLGGIDGVAREKSALFEELSGPRSIAIGNADDPRVASALMVCDAGRRVSFGTHERASYRILRREPSGSRQRLVIAADREIVVHTPLLGRAGALATAAALCAVEALTGEALAPERFEAGLAGSAGRLEPRRGAGGCYILDDSYNANPASCRASIEAAAEIAGAEGRALVLVLGEMRELGSATTREHEALADVVADAGPRLLITIGAAAGLTAARAERLGVRVEHAASAEEASAIARRCVEPGDVVLVKGSRGVRTERVVEALVGGDAPSRPHGGCSAGGAP